MFIELRKAYEEQVFRGVLSGNINDTFSQSQERVVMSFYMAYFRSVQRQAKLLTSKAFLDDTETKSIKSFKSNTPEGIKKL